MKHPPFAAPADRELEALPFADRLDLAAAARAAVLAAAEAAGVPPPAAGEWDAIAGALEGEASGVYLEARVNGLCHEGALELFRDAVRLAAPGAVRDRAAGAPPGSP